MCQTTAAWELYIEEVLSEAVEFARGKAAAPDDLPMDVKKAIAAYAVGSQHELKALAMAGNGVSGNLDAAGPGVADRFSPCAHTGLASAGARRASHSEVRASCRIR